MNKMIMFLFAFSFCFVNHYSAFSVEIKHRSFSKQEIDMMKNTKAIIQTRFGDISLQFFPDVAPNHVDNFISLSEKRFYEGTIFHRVIPGFMIQGGDPNSKSKDKTRHGMGGPGYYLKAEFNDRPHKKGTLSMARTSIPDTAGSQFFICAEKVPHLDGQYTVFGEVTAGMDVGEKIVSAPRDQNDNPFKRIEMTIKIIREKK